MTWVDKDVRVLSRKHISRELRVFLIFICGKTLTFLLLVLVQIELLLSAPENLCMLLSFDWKRSSCNDDYDDTVRGEATQICCDVQDDEKEMGIGSDNMMILDWTI